MTPDPMREYGRALLACVVAPLVGDPRLQAQALHLGDINFLNDAEAAGADAANYANMDRPWELWKMRVRQSLR